MAGEIKNDVPYGYWQLSDTDVLQPGDMWSGIGLWGSAEKVSDIAVGMTLADFNGSAPKTPLGKAWRKLHTPSAAQDSTRRTLTESELRHALGAIAEELAGAESASLCRVAFVLDGLLGWLRRVPSDDTLRLCLRGEVQEDGRD